MKNFLKHTLTTFALVFAATTHAQTFPVKPIKIIVPFPAGGTVDFFARVISTKLSDALGQSVLVENRAGAGGNIAAEAVAKATPDGYTLLMGSEIIAINTSLYSKLGYDPVKDLAPITLVDISLWFVTPKALSALVLGGFGSIPGAIVGGLLIGLIEQYAGVYMPDGTKDIVAYLVLIAVLIVRPHGLLGEAHGRRV